MGLGDYGRLSTPYAIIRDYRRPEAQRSRNSGTMLSGFWEKTFKNVHSFDRAHSEAGFKPISSHKMLRFQAMRMSGVFFPPRRNVMHVRGCPFNILYSSVQRFIASFALHLCQR